VWRLIETYKEAIRKGLSYCSSGRELSEQFKDLRYSSHHTVKKWLEDVDKRMQYNTAIAAVMEHLNNVTSIKEPNKLGEAELAVFARACVIIPRMLYPFAPHIAEEIWQLLGNKTLLHEAGMPTYKPEHLVRDTISYVIQINGKIRGKMDVQAETSEENIKAMALEIDNVKKTIEGKTIRKVIIIPNKMVSIAIS
jgi:leucyl-tRNA synthetase